MSKVKLATAWLEVCSGCHMSFLDIDEEIVPLLEKVQICYSPVADPKAIPKVDVGVISGALGNDEEMEIAREMRENCDILIGWGDCAVFGGINCMRNTYSREEALVEAYVNSPSTVNPEGILPGEDIPTLLPKALPIDYAVKVDVYVPGCPPDAETILWVFKELLEGRIPKVPVDMMRYD
ncbi:MAG: NADP oxidoreductase [Synergistales bacterium]|nr:NADP oxidoreductase [Synergistales bacterium]